MSDSPTCKRCGGRIVALATRAWCSKPSLDGGCGGIFHYDETLGRFRRHGTRKVARVEPIVKDRKSAPAAAAA